MVQGHCRAYKGHCLNKVGIKKHIELSHNLWIRFMNGKLDCSIFDDDRALDYSVSVRVLLHKYDSTGLIRQLFTGEIDNSDYRKAEWWRRHKAWDDICLIRVALHQGGYPVYCKGSTLPKCQRCKVY